MNIMLLSVSVWSGADAETTAGFPLDFGGAGASRARSIPAAGLLSLPPGRALRHGRTNMDVPISIGVLLAFGLSLYDTIHDGEHAYFDAAISLLFFLLIGRTLDHVMREKARSGRARPGAAGPRGATVVRRRRQPRLSAVDRDRARHADPASARATACRSMASCVEGTSDLDCSLVDGRERAAVVSGPASTSRPARSTSTGPLTMVATARAENSFLAEMVRADGGGGGRAGALPPAGRPRRALYAPVVHATAFLTFLGWMLATGDWHRAIGIAIAVLIITCPCALGLAVPIVQVVAARRLFENGIMVKDGSGIERLAEIDTAVFDKTGTLTLGQPRLVDAGLIEPGALAIAAAMAAQSSHPLSRAIAAAGGDGRQDRGLTDLVEHPGLGVEGAHRTAISIVSAGPTGRSRDGGSQHAAGTVLARDGKPAWPRLLSKTACAPDARGAVSAPCAGPVSRSTILSGDQAPARRRDRRAARHRRSCRRPAAG